MTTYYIEWDDGSEEMIQFEGDSSKLAFHMAAKQQNDPAGRKIVNYRPLHMGGSLAKAEEFGFGLTPPKRDYGSGSLGAKLTEAFQKKREEKERR